MLLAQGGIRLAQPDRAQCQQRQRERGRERHGEPKRQPALGTLQSVEAQAEAEHPAIALAHRNRPGKLEHRAGGHDLLTFAYLAFTDGCRHRVVPGPEPRGGWQCSVCDVKIAAIERDIGKLRRARRNVLQEAVERHLLLQGFDFRRICVEQDRPAARSSNAGRHPSAAAPPRTVQLPDEFRRVTGEDPLQRNASSRPSPTRPETVPGAAARTRRRSLARSLRREDRHSEQLVLLRDAVEQGLVERVSPVQFREQSRVVQEALADLALGLRSRDVVGTGGRRDGLTQRLRLVPQQAQQLGTSRGVVEPPHDPETGGRDQAGGDDAQLHHNQRIQKVDRLFHDRPSFWSKSAFRGSLAPGIPLDDLGNLERPP